MESELGSIFIPQKDTWLKNVILIMSCIGLCM